MAARGFIGLRQYFGVAGSLHEYPVPVLAGCLVALLLIFVGDVSSPATVVLTPLYIVPAAVAAALLSYRCALCVFSAAIGLQIVGRLLEPSTIDSVLAGAGALMLVFVLVRLLPVSGALVNDAGYGALDGKLKLLTRREREVADRVAEGRSASEIARQLHISRRTVETHIARSYAKLGVTSRVELILKTAQSRGNPPAGMME